MSTEELIIFFIGGIMGVMQLHAIFFVLPRRMSLKKRIAITTPINWVLGALVLHITGLLYVP